MTSTAAQSAERNATPIARPAHRFVALDGLRGIAAIAVVLFHFAGADRPSLTPRGYLAVDFFFILSGLVLDHAYGLALESRRLSAGAFMWARWFRLWPVAALGIVLGAIEFATRGDWSAAMWPSLVCGILILPVLTPNGSFYQLNPLNPPHWSLFHELSLNVVYALIAPWLTRRVLAAVVVGAGVALLVTTIRLGGREYFGPARVAYGFFAGVALHRVRTGKPLTLWAALVAAVVLMGVFSLPRSVGRAPGDAFLALAVLPIVVSAASRVELRGAVARMASALGALSYPLYAIHFPLIRFLTRRPTSTAGSVAATLVLCLVAYAVAIWFDEPVRLRLRRATKLSGSQSGGATPSSDRRRRPSRTAEELTREERPGW